MYVYTQWLAGFHRNMALLCMITQRLTGFHRNMALLCLITPHLAGFPKIWIPWVWLHFAWLDSQKYGFFLVYDYGAFGWISQNAWEWGLWEWLGLWGQGTPWGVRPTPHPLGGWGPATSSLLVVYNGLQVS